MYKLIKFGFNATINSFKAIQFCLVLTALLTMVDFILVTAHVKLPEQIQVFFDTIYKFQSTFYKPSLLIPVDFTLAVAAVEMLILAGIIVYILYFVIEFEQVYDKVHRDNCKRYERSFNQSLEKNAKNIEIRNKNFVMYFDVNIEANMQELKFADVKAPDVETKKMEYRMMFRNYILQNFKGNCVKTANGYLIFFDNIENCDAIFDKTYEFVSKSKELLKQMYLKFSLKSAVCIAKQHDPQEKYLPKLQKLLNIASPNKIMALADFKVKYDTIKNKNYVVNSIGEYSLGEDIIDVYTFEPNRQ